MLRHYFLTSIRTLRQNPLYTALSVFGIALTFVFVSILLMISGSIDGDFIPAKYSERTWRADWIERQNNSPRSLNKELSETLTSKMKTPEMMVVMGSPWEENIIVNDVSRFLTIIGVGDKYFDMCRFKLISGRLINRQEIADAARVAVLDRNTANIYFGQEEATGKYIEYRANQYHVVGVVENAKLFAIDQRVTWANIWMPLETMPGNVRYQILFTAKDKSSIADMQAEFIRVLNEINTMEDAEYSVANWRKKTLAQLGLGDAKILLTTIGCLILMLIPALNILSLNISKSHERSEEIAIRKAFGAPLHTIFGQLLLENTMLTLAGAIIGMSATLFLVQAIDRLMFRISVMPMVLSLQFNWVSIFVVAVPCVLVFSFLSGSIPAWITAKKDIVNVLKGEVQ